MTPTAPTGTKPLPPATLVATSRATQATLTWSASVGATSYNVYSSLVSGGPYKLLVVGLTNLYYVDMGLVNGATYDYVVTAVNANGESGYSSQAQAAIPMVEYLYIVESGTEDQLETLINTWNGSSYQLRFIYHGWDISRTGLGPTCFCIWEKAVLPT